MTRLIKVADAMAGYFFDEEMSFRDIAPGDWLWIASLPVAGVIALVMVISGM